MRHLHKYWLNKDVDQGEQVCEKDDGQDMGLTEQQKDSKLKLSKREEDDKILKVIAKIESIVGESMHELVESTAFLISLTSRDSSFLIRCAVSRENNEFEVLEEWEKGNVKEHVDEIRVEYHNAEPAPQKPDDFDQEKQMVFLTHLMNKINFGYDKQRHETLNESRTYYIKSRTNLCDVSIKPWAKLHSYVKSNHKVNQNFVNFFIDNRKEMANKSVNKVD